MKPASDLAAVRRERIAARDAATPEWEASFAALKRGARAAADDGAPHLYKALFDEPARPPRAKKAKVAQRPPAPPPPNGAPTD
jgi:hypothetical protein